MIIRSTYNLVSDVFVVTRSRACISIVCHFLELIVKEQGTLEGRGIMQQF